MSDNDIDIKGCKWIEPWNGFCERKRYGFDPYCHFHANVRCVICDKQATRGCDDRLGEIFCGASLCDNVQCYIFHVERDHGFRDTRTKVAQSIMRKHGKGKEASVCASEWVESKKKLIQAQGEDDEQRKSV